MGVQERGAQGPGALLNGGKTHRFSLSRGNLTDRLLPTEAHRLLAPGEARPWEPRLRPKCRMTARLQEKPGMHVHARQQGSCCLWSLCAHRVPKGRALCTREDPKTQRECATGAPREQSRGKSRTFPGTGQAIHAHPCLHLHISASLPADLRARGCHSLPFVSSEVFPMACKTQSGWR